MKISLVELPATVKGKLFGKRINDVYSMVNLPSRAIDLLRAIIEEHGYDDVKTINPLFNKKKGRLTEAQLDRMYTSDIVGISVISRTAPQSYELADCIKEVSPDTIVIFGGPHVSALPEEALLHGDIVVRNEGDLTFPELVASLDRCGMDETALLSIDGISFTGKDGLVHHTQRRRAITEAELSALPFPVYTDEIAKKVDFFTVNTSRGCPYDCEFCSVVAHFGKQYRRMDEDRIIDLLAYIADKTTKQTVLFFSDDNFAGNPGKTKKLLRRIIDEKIPLPNWVCQVRVESAQDSELLDLMKATGCVKVYIGFESINEKTLALWNKKANIEKTRNAISRYHERGIDIHGMFVLGSEADTEDTVLDTAQFANKLAIDTVQFFSITPLPGTRLAARYEKEHKVLSKEWEKYSCQEVVTYPESISPLRLQKAIIRAYKKFYSIPGMISRIITKLKAGYKVSGLSLVIMGIFLKRIVVNEMKPHIKVLKRVDRATFRIDEQLKKWIEATGIIERLGKGQQFVSREFFAFRDVVENTLNEQFDRLSLSKEQLELIVSDIMYSVEKEFYRIAGLQQTTTLSS